MTLTTQTKNWITIGTYDSFEEANKKRNELVHEHTLIKVRRGYKVYRVKVWDPPVIEEKIKKSKADYKKGKNDKRQSKYSNKKIRA
jgi:hypothetical protein